MDKVQKLRERGYFINLLNGFTKSIKDSLESLSGLIDEKVFRVRIENEKYFVKALETTATAMEKTGNSLRELKLAENLSEVKCDLIHSINAGSTQGMNIDKVETINVQELAQTEVVAALQELGTKLSALEDLKKQMGIVANKDVVIPTMPKSMAIDGEVGIDSLPAQLYSKLSDVENAIKKTTEVIRSQKIEIPVQKDITFPKSIDVGNLKTLEKSIADLKTSIDKMPDMMPKVEFPTEIKTHVVSEPPRLTPQPVTNININPLSGTTKTTSVSVSTNPVALPGTASLKRRSIILFNNHATETLYIGPSSVTTSNGLPILAQSYSPAIDAGSNMIIYGVSASATIDVRVFEANNESFGI